MTQPHTPAQHNKRRHNPKRGTKPCKTPIPKPALLRAASSLAHRRHARRAPRASPRRPPSHRLGRTLSHRRTGWGGRSGTARLPPRGRCAPRATPAALRVKGGGGAAPRAGARGRLPGREACVCKGGAGRGWHSGRWAIHAASRGALPASSLPAAGLARSCFRLGARGCV